MKPNEGKRSGVRVKLVNTPPHLKLVVQVLSFFSTTDKHA